MNTQETGKLYITNNQPSDLRRRKDENTLVVIGGGVICFGVWSIIKTILHMIYNRAEFFGGWNDLERAERIFSIVFTILVLLMDLLIRVYVGRSAQAEGRGQKKGSLYLVLAALLSLISVASLAFLIGYSDLADVSLPDSIISVVVELTAVITQVEMIVAAICVRRERKNMNAGAEQDGLMQDGSGR